MPIPAFRDDGYLPEGLYGASEEEIIARFGQSTPHREYLMGRLRHWLELAQAVRARRFFINGSRGGETMICSETEYQGAQREIQYLKDFLSRVEHAPDHPNQELSLIGIYKKMYHLWEELEEYYRVRFSEIEQVEDSRLDGAGRAWKRTEVASVVASD